MVSPEFLLWDSEYYYLVAYDEQIKGIRHYRVDKIVEARELEENRGGIQERAGLNKADYARKRFGMFAGQMRTVVLRCKKTLVGVMLDRFGTQIAVRPEGTDEIVVRAEIEVSPQFFGWLTGMGADVGIVSPADIREEYRNFLEKILRKYDEMMQEQTQQE